MKNFFLQLVIPSFAFAIPFLSYGQITVNSSLDQVAANPSVSANTSGGVVTIRSAIQYANLHSGTTITFNPALNGVPLTLTIAGANENNAATGDLDIKAAVTITGNGPTNTIIQAGTNATNGIDKVFSVNPLFNAAFATTISGLTMRYGRNPGTFAGDGFGGGLDWEGSGNGTLTINNCVITNNSTTDGDGGGLALTNSSVGTGSATIINSTISNNTPARVSASASPVGGGIFIGTTTAVFLTNCVISGNSVSGSGGQGQGGGIYSFGPGGSAGQSSLTNCTILNNTSPSDGGGILSTQPLTITSCTFSGNNSGRFGGALFINHSNATTTVSKTTFTNNNAGSRGGAINHGTSTTANALTVSYSRFSGNTAPAQSGVAIESGTGTLQNNWWGCNEGPANAACNQTAVVPGGSGSVNFTPWIVLTHSPASGSICANSNTGLTASFLKNSANGNIAASNLDAFAGASVTFTTVTPAGATVTAVTTVSNGVATAQYNPNNTSGSGGANAVFNNASVNAAITVNPLPANPTLTASPSATITCAQTSLTLTAGGGSSYAFSGPGVVSRSGNQAVVNVAGTYSVTVTNGTTGCFSTTTITISQNTTAPTPTLSASPSTTLSCSQTSLTLTAGGGQQLRLLAGRAW